MIPAARLGADGPCVSAQGFGCMGLVDAAESVRGSLGLAALRHALDLGVTLIDTADCYDGGRSEEAVGVAASTARDAVTISTKVGLRGPPGARRVDASPVHIYRACEQSLARLNVDVIDVYFLHRSDPAIPIEESIGAMSRLVEVGKVRHVGLCEASVDTILRATAVHSICAVQAEWSVFSRDIEERVVPTCRRLGIGLLASSPLSRGLLTGAVQPSDWGPDDPRHFLPRFSPTHLRQNLKRAAMVRRLADAREVSPAQVALAWLSAKGADVIALPATRRVSHVAENCSAATLALTDDELTQLDGLEALGARTPELA